MDSPLLSMKRVLSLFSCNSVPPLPEFPSVVGVRLLADPALLHSFAQDISPGQRVFPIALLGNTFRRGVVSFSTARRVFPSKHLPVAVAVWASYLHTVR